LAQATHADSLVDSRHNVVNFFVIGYVLLFASCEDTHSARAKAECKSGQGGKITLCIFLMVCQVLLQVYLALVTTWFKQEYEVEQESNA